MRPLLPATSTSRTDNDDKGLGVFTGDVGTQTSLWGLNWEIQTPPTAGAQHSRGGRGGGADTLCSALLSSPLLQKETLHATASHWSGPICEGANIVDLHETWVSCRSMKCQALCLSLRHSLPLNANALVVVMNCLTVLMYVGPGPLESWTCISKS